MSYTFGISPFFTASAVACASIGGLLLGIAVMFKSGVVGRVLGISTYTKRLFVQPCADRYMMILGLIASGVLMKVLYGGIEPMPPPGLSSGEHARLFVRQAVGGVLIGAGSTLQNGCTSGHGLTGLARLSLRSWVAVPAFMGAGILTATLSGSARALPANAATEAESPAWTTALILAACIAVTLGLLAAMSRWIASAAEGEDPENSTALRVMTLVAELCVGLSFGCGLVISGMSRPSKVAAFLDLGSGTWDLSLAFVMGGALMLTFPFFQVAHFRGMEKPVLRGPLEWPSRMAPVDRSLVAGAVLFGVGWGTCGMCPGPVWVASGAMPSFEVATVLFGMLVGIATVVLIKNRLAAKTSTGPAETTIVNASFPKQEDDHTGGEKAIEEVA